MATLRTLFLIVLLVLSVPMAYGNGDAIQQDQTDSTAVELREVVVKSEKVKVFADHDEMILSRENRNFGANAIDAISSLPLFRTQVAASELTNLRGEKVNVVINGRFASAEQLATYRGQEIKSVNYYPFTPSRYQAYCTGPLIEVSILRPRDAYVSINLNEGLMGEATDKHPVDFLSNTTDGTFTYMDSVHMLKADYRFSYSNKRNLVREIEQRTGGSGSFYSTDDGREERITHDATLNYQYDKGANTFSAIAGYGRVPRYHLDLLMGSAALSASEDDTRETHRSQDQEAVSASLFYDHDFKDRSKLTVSAEGSVTWTDLSESLKIGGAEPEAFANASDVNSRVLRYHLRVYYTRQLGKGELNASAYTMTDDMRQSYCGETMPRATTSFGTVDVSYRVNPGNLSLDASIGCGGMDNRLQGHSAMTALHPTGTLRVGWRINSRLSLRMWSNLGVSFNTTGLDYDNKYYDGENYYQQGNFDIKPMTNTYHVISCTYTGGDGKVTVGGGMSVQYDTNPSFQYIVKNGDDYVRTTMNARRYISLRPDVYGSFRPTGWLGISISAAYNRYGNPYVPSGDVIRYHELVRLSGQITANYHGFFISANARNGSRIYRGDELTIDPFTCSVQGAWRHKDFFASLTWAYNLGHSTAVMESGDFFWSEFSPKYRPNTLSLTISYTFSHGVYKQKKTKGVGVGTDSGLMRGAL